MLPLLLLSWTVVPSSQAAVRGGLGPVVSLSLSEQLTVIQKKIAGVESEWQQRPPGGRDLKQEVRLAQKLALLHRQQKQVADRRIQELEKTLSDLDSKKNRLSLKMTAQQARVMRMMRALESSHRQTLLAPGSNQLSSWIALEKTEAPRRKLMAQWVDHGIKGIEALKIDLSDSQQIEKQIHEEKQQIVYLTHEAQEQLSALALNQKFQREAAKSEKNGVRNQVENYHKLKASENQVEHLISEFNARAELEHAMQDEKQIARAMQEGEFARRRGKLPLPIAGGRVVSLFGKGFDPLSGVQVFKKGVEISGQKGQAVVAVSAGKVAYSGELPGYGRVLIVDQGQHFYTLFGHLGSAMKKAKEWVRAGELIGFADPQGAPVYFEIRSRNLAVNPLQWVAN